MQLQDFVSFGDCMAGPSLEAGSPPCMCLDLDGDSNVDLADMAEFQLSLN